MKLINPTLFIRASILVVLICAGFWFYNQWGIKQFESTLPKEPPVQTNARETVPAEHTIHPGKLTEATETAETKRPIEGTPLEDSETIDGGASNGDSVVGASTEAADFNSFLEPFLKEMDADAGAPGDIDITDISEETPYDIEVVNAGFDDYNAYLKSDPEYAYQRLDDALREQYGDDSDVDILVAHTKRLNNGTSTVDSIIENLEAQRRLLVKNNYPGQQEIFDNIEYFREMKLLSLESGTEIKIRSGSRVDTGR